MNKFTPGPWFVTGCEKTCIEDVRKNTVAFVSERRIDHETITANADLIAASPMLYEACRTTLEYLELHNFENVQMVKGILRGALSLAKVDTNG